jgi:hypothetical protein
MVLEAEKSKVEVPVFGEGLLAVLSHGRRAKDERDSFFYNQCTPKITTLFYYSS